MSTGALRVAGLTSYYWSDMASLSELDTYNFYILDDNVYLSDASDRWIGFTGRKVSLVPDRKAKPASVVVRREDGRAIEIEIVRIEPR